MQEIYEKLDKVSPSFCLAKWKMLTLYLNSGMAHSCYHPRRHKIGLDEIAQNPSALHNSRHKKLARKQMLEGERPEECDYCWKMEDLGQLSDRAIHSGHTCDINELESIAATPWDSDDVMPTTIEIAFSSTCNLKCSYCSPDVSSKWYEESLQYGGYPTHSNFNGHVTKDSAPYILEREDNPYIDAFWKWFPDVLEQQKRVNNTVRVTGGEPLLTKHTFRLLEMLSTDDHPHMNLAVNSNLCVPDKNLDNYIRLGNTVRPRVYAFRTFTSIDGVGERAEYQRFGLDYEQWLRNVHRVLREIDGSQIDFMVTFNAMSIGNFEGFLQLVMDLRAEYGRGRINFDLPYLRFPKHQSVALLPKSYDKYFAGLLDFMDCYSTARDNILGFDELEIEKMKRLRAYMNDGFDDDEQKLAQKDLYLFVNEHDRRRGTNFLKTFPELEEVYEIGRKLNE